MLRFSPAAHFTDSSGSETPPNCPSQLSGTPASHPRPPRQTLNAAHTSASTARSLVSPGTGELTISSVPSELGSPSTGEIPYAASCPRRYRDAPLERTVFELSSPARYPAACTSSPIFSSSFHCQGAHYSRNETSYPSAPEPLPPFPTNSSSAPSSLVALQPHFNQRHGFPSCSPSSQDPSSTRATESGCWLGQQQQQRFRPISQSGSILGESDRSAASDASIASIRSAAMMASRSVPALVSHASSKRVFPIRAQQHQLGISSGSSCDHNSANRRDSPTSPCLDSSISSSSYSPSRQDAPFQPAGPRETMRDGSFDEATRQVLPVNECGEAASSGMKRRSAPPGPNAMPHQQHLASPSAAGTRLILPTWRNLPLFGARRYGMARQKQQNPSPRRPQSRDRLVQIPVDMASTTARSSTTVYSSAASTSVTEGTSPLHLNSGRGATTPESHCIVVIGASGDATPQSPAPLEQQRVLGSPYTHPNSDLASANSGVASSWCSEEGEQSEMISASHSGNASASTQNFETPSPLTPAALAIDVRVLSPAAVPLASPSGVRVSEAKSSTQSITAAPVPASSSFPGMEEQQVLMTQAVAGVAPLPGVMPGTQALIVSEEVTSPITASDDGQQKLRAVSYTSGSSRYYSPKSQAVFASVASSMSSSNASHSAASPSRRIPGSRPATLSVTPTIGSAGRLDAVRASVDVASLGIGGTANLGATSITPRLRTCWSDSGILRRPPTAFVPVPVKSSSPSSRSRSFLSSNVSGSPPTSQPIRGVPEGARRGSRNEANSTARSLELSAAAVMATNHHGREKNHGWRKGSPRKPVHRPLLLKDVPRWVGLMNQLVVKARQERRSKLEEKIKPRGDTLKSIRTGGMHTQYSQFTRQPMQLEMGTSERPSTGQNHDASSMAKSRSGETIELLVMRQSRHFSDTVAGVNTREAYDGCERVCDPPSPTDSAAPPAGSSSATPSSLFARDQHIKGASNSSGPSEPNQALFRFPEVAVRAGPPSEPQYELPARTPDNSGSTTPRQPPSNANALRYASIVPAYVPLTLRRPFDWTVQRDLLLGGATISAYSDHRMDVHLLKAGLAQVIPAGRYVGGVTDRTQSPLMTIRDLYFDTAATLIQKVWRGYQARQRYELMVVEHQQRQRLHNAAARIEAAWRGVQARWDFDYKIQLKLHTMCRDLAARRIQLAWRAWRARREAELNEIVAVLSRMRNASATLVQKVWRGYQVRKIIDEEWNYWVVKWIWDPPGKKVQVIGSFTEEPWAERVPMTWCPRRRCYTAKLPRKRGRYELKFSVDGRFVCCGASTVVEDGSGHFNNVVDVYDVQVESPFVRCRRILAAYPEQYRDESLHQPDYVLTDDPPSVTDGGVAQTVASDGDSPTTEAQAAPRSSQSTPFQHRHRDHRYAATAQHGYSGAPTPEAQPQLKATATIRGINGSLRRISELHDGDDQHQTTYRLTSDADSSQLLAKPLACESALLQAIPDPVPRLDPVAIRPADPLPGKSLPDVSDLFQIRTAESPSTDSEHQLPPSESTTEITNIPAGAGLLNAAPGPHIATGDSTAEATATEAALPMVQLGTVKVPSVEHHAAQRPFSQKASWNTTPGDLPIEPLETEGSPATSRRYRSPLGLPQISSETLSSSPTSGTSPPPSHGQSIRLSLPIPFTGQNYPTPGDRRHLSVANPCQASVAGVSGSGSGSGSGGGGDSVASPLRRLSLQVDTANTASPQHTAEEGTAVAAATRRMAELLKSS